MAADSLLAVTWTRALVVLSCAIAACHERAPRPNVLLISVDSLRRDHVGAYGYANARNPSEPTTPSVDRLAARGVVFDDAVSTTSWTLPAHMALMTGLSDPLHGVTYGKRLDAVMSALPTLNEAIKNGYPLRILGDPAFYEPLAVATDKGDPEFDAKIAEVVKAMHEDGTLSKLSQKWYGVDLTRAKAAS